MKTSLYEEHVKLNARIVDFHGWKMPVWYSGIKAEHMATRTACGLFDVCHMGETFISGKESVALLNRILTIDVGKMAKGRVRYSFLLNEDGGIIDDLTVYCVEPRMRYMLCLNASNRQKDCSWIRSHMVDGCEFEDCSDSTGMLAVQGPDAADVLKKCLDFELDSLGFYHFTLRDDPEYGRLMISRTGYTGECGVEIFMSDEKVEKLWRTFVAQGAVPCGLGARDTLRLEMGYPLHGNDIDETTSPLEAGLGFALEMELDFIGRQSLVKQKNEGVRRRLRGIELLGRGVPRQGCECISDGKVVGAVTSGSVSPVLEKGIALCYLDTTINISDEIAVVVRSKEIRAKVVKPPFVESGLKRQKK